MTETLPGTPPDFEDLHELVELMSNSSRFSALALRAGSVELVLRREDPEVSDGAAADIPPQPSSNKAEAGAAAAGSRHVITSPSVGTVRMPAGTSSVAGVSQAVEPGMSLCEVEVLGRLEEVVAARKGVIRQILVADAETVEFGQSLFVLDPA